MAVAGRGGHAPSTAPRTAGPSGARYIRADALADVDRAWERLDDVAVEVTPDKRRSWCGSTLHEETQRELSVPYGDIWLGD